MIPPCYLYPRLDQGPSRPRRRARASRGPWLVASVLAGGASGALAGAAAALLALA